MNKIIDVKVVCVHCKYSWFTESMLLRVSCPNCGKKTKVKS